MVTLFILGAGMPDGEFGRYAGALSFAAILWPLCSLGADVRMLDRDRNGQDLYYHAMQLSAGICLSVAALALIAGCILDFGFASPYVCSCFLAFALAFHNIQSVLLTRSQRFWLLALYRCGSAGLFLILIFAFDSMEAEQILLLNGLSLAMFAIAAHFTTFACIPYTRVKATEVNFTIVKSRMCNLVLWQSAPIVLNMKFGFELGGTISFSFRLCQSAIGLYNKVVQSAYIGLISRQEPLAGAFWRSVGGGVLTYVASAFAIQSFGVLGVWPKMPLGQGVFSHPMFVFSLNVVAMLMLTRFVSSAVSNTAALTARYHLDLVVNLSCLTVFVLCVVLSFLIEPAEVSLVVFFLLYPFCVCIQIAGNMKCIEHGRNG